MTASEKQMAWYAAIGFGVYWLLFRKDPVTGQSGLETIVGNVAQSTAGAAASLPGNIASGVVVGIGKTVGIPATNVDKCQADIAAGDTWNASFDCTASQFFDYLRS